MYGYIQKVQVILKLETVPFMTMEAVQLKYG